MTEDPSPESEPLTTSLWSIATQVTPGTQRAPRDAFNALCLAYVYPVYAYVRRSGHAPAIAVDITRSFLGGLLATARPGSEGPSTSPRRPRNFRRYLLERLNAFLSRDWWEAFDDALPESVLAQADSEVRYQRDCAQTASPEEAFQRSFALELLTRASRRLANEARQTGHLDLYEKLLPFIASDPTPGLYDEVAQQLHTRALAVVVALKRLRQRFRELVGDELTDTVTTLDDLDAERQMLHAMFEPAGFSELQ